jgi:GTP cyclohydrolase II
MAMKASRKPARGGALHAAGGARHRLHNKIKAYALQDKGMGHGRSQPGAGL